MIDIVIISSIILIGLCTLAIRFFPLHYQFFDTTKHAKLLELLGLLVLVGLLTTTFSALIDEAIKSEASFEIIAIAVATSITILCQKYHGNMMISIVIGMVTYALISTYLA